MPNSIEYILLLQCVYRVHTQKRNEEKFFLKIFVQKLWPKKEMKKRFLLNICTKIMAKKGFGGFTKEARNFGGLWENTKFGRFVFFIRLKWTITWALITLGFNFGMLKNVGIFLVRQILKLDLALGMPWRGNLGDYSIMKVIGRCKMIFWSRGSWGCYNL